MWMMRGLRGELGWGLGALGVRKAVAAFAWVRMGGEKEKRQASKHRRRIVRMNEFPIELSC